MVKAVVCWAKAKVNAFGIKKEFYLTARLVRTAGAGFAFLCREARAPVIS